MTNFLNASHTSGLDASSTSFGTSWKVRDVPPWIKERKIRGVTMSSYENKTKYSWHFHSNKKVARKTNTPITYNYVIRIYVWTYRLFCHITIFCQQLIQNTTTDFVRFTKICTNCFEIQNTNFAKFQFQNNMSKSLLIWRNHIFILG